MTVIRSSGAEPDQGRASSGSETSEIHEVRGYTLQGNVRERAKKQTLGPWRPWDLGKLCVVIPHPLARGPAARPRCNPPAGERVESRAVPIPKGRTYAN